MTFLQTNEKVISEDYIYKSIYIKVHESHTHPYGLSKDVIKMALDSLNNMKIIKKYKK